jgi:hypothetical protein
MTVALWRYPGIYNGRIEAQNSSLVSVLDSYYYGGLAPYSSYEYAGSAYVYGYHYYEGFAYYSGHVWCAGDDATNLPDIRCTVGQTAGLYQNRVNDLVNVSYLQYLAELRTRSDHPKSARTLVSAGQVTLSTAALALIDTSTDPVTVTPLTANVVILPYPGAASLFRRADRERLIRLSGLALNTDGVYRISEVPWNMVPRPAAVADGYTCNVRAVPRGAYDYYNGQMALIEMPGMVDEVAPAATAEMLGLRWRARCYYDAAERMVLEERQGRAYPRTLHSHFSKATARLRTVRYDVKLEAVDTNDAEVAAAAGMSCSVPAPAFYLDEIYIATTTDSLGLLNCIPQDSESGVPATDCVRLHVVSFTSDALNPTVRVWMTRSSTGARTLVYDQAAGGFQAGYNGVRSSATLQASPDSGVNDELLLVIDPTSNFVSLETVLVEVTATTAVGSLNTSYAFTVEDLTVPALEEILWLTPRRARLKYNEPVSTSDDPLGSTFIISAASGVEVLSTSTIRLAGITPSEDWIGYKVSLSRSLPENAGPWTVVSVDEDTGEILLNTTALVVDDGIDKNAFGAVVQRRDIAASISPYYLEARLSAEGAGTLPDSADRVQCAYCPIPVAVTAVEAEELPTGEDAREYVYVDFIDDISIGRLYTIHACGVEDLYGNACTDAELDFTSPTFGSPTQRLNLWSDGLTSGIERADDLGNEGCFRRLAVVLQDALNVLWWRVDELQYLEDPGRCDPLWLDYLLYELGCPFQFPISSESLRRKLANALPGFYKKIGCEQGIVDMLFLLLGITFEIDPYIDLAYWQIGFSQLGVNTRLGLGSSWLQNAYEIISPVDLTDEQRRIVRDVATWADPVDLHLVRIVEPSTSTALVPGYWQLGFSALGISTMLGG